jgi:hypothetical protein
MPEDKHPDAQLLAAYERLTTAGELNPDEFGDAHTVIRNLPARTLQGVVVKLRSEALLHDDAAAARVMHEAADVIERHLGGGA